MIASTMPSEPRRQRPRISPPTPDARSADPAERKRILNVLAQRRYRQRKREKVQQLEQLEAQQILQEPQYAQDYGSEIPYVRDSSLSIDRNSVPSRDDPNVLQLPGFLTEFAIEEFDFDLDVPLQGTESLTSSTSSTSSEEANANAASNSSNVPSQIGSCSSPTVSDLLQTTETALFTFPDSFELPVSSLSLLRASLIIATRLRSSEILWNPMSTSIFLQPGTTPETWHSELPPHLRPTKAQLTTTHHPILDLLPWPKARQRLIHMFSLPEELWPLHRADGTKLSVFRLVYDLEDDGVRVHNEDPTQSNSWEVRPDFVDNWWWALDYDILKIANIWRSERGEAQLRIGSGGSES